VMGGLCPRSRVHCNQGKTGLLRKERKKDFWLNERQELPSYEPENSEGRVMED